MEKEGERNKGYFYYLKNRAQTRKAIDRLKINDDKYVHDQIAILDENKSFKGHSINPKNVTKTSPRVVTS